MEDASFMAKAKAIGRQATKELGTKEGQDTIRGNFRNFLHFLGRVGFWLVIAFLANLLVPGWWSWLALPGPLPAAIVTGALALVAVFGAYYMHTQALQSDAARHLYAPVSKAYTLNKERFQDDECPMVFADHWPTKHAWDTSFDYLKEEAITGNPPWRALLAVAVACDELLQNTDATRFINQMRRGEFGRILAHIPMYHAVVVAVLGGVTIAVPYFQTPAMSFILLWKLVVMGWHVLHAFTKRI